MNPQIIIVNDDLEHLALMNEILAKQHLEVHAFDNTQDALDFIAFNPVDLIITDLYMPGMDGWHFCRRLRSPAFAHANQIPVLIVSATFSDGDGQAILRDTGANAFLAAPYSIKELCNVTNRLLQNHTQQAKARVLVVQHDATARQALADELITYGYAPIEAADAQEAVAQLDTHTPDIIIIAHEPPELDGIALLPTIRQANADVVLIVVSSDPSPELAPRAMQSGAQAYVRTPFSLTYLIDLAIQAQRERIILDIERALEERNKQVMRNARRIRRLNEVFVSLGSNTRANIETLTETAGVLLHASFAVYYASTTSTLRILAGWHLPPDLPREMNAPGHLAHHILQQSTHDPFVIRHLPNTSFAKSDPSVKRYGLHTLVGCPVPRNRNHMGVLCLAYKQDHPPSPQDLDLLQVLARALGQQEQLQQRNRELAALNEISRIVTSAFSLDEMLSLLRTKARQVINAEACSILLVSPDSDELVFYQADGPHADELIGHRLQIGQGIAGWVAQTGQSMLVSDVYTDQHFYKGADKITGFGTREIICVPLISQDKVTGVLELANKRAGKFAPEDMYVIESIASQVASAIQNAHLLEQTRQELEERIRIDKALRQSQTRLRTFIDATPDLIFLKDDQFRYLLINQANAEWFGLDFHEIIGKTDFDLMPPEIAQMCQESDRRAIESRQSVITEEHAQDRIYESHKIPILDDEGKVSGIAGIIRDITERKRMEEQLLQQRKEESMLTLAGGIAHDFNNALVGIIGNIDLLRLEIPDDSYIAQLLDSMERSSDRMTELTNQILTYAGGGTYQPRLIDLNIAVENALQSVCDFVAPNITVARSLGTNLWEVNTDPAQIKRMLTSLLTNACEAMAEQGGTLSVRTENVLRQTWTCPLNRQHPAGEYIHLVISDTGSGMSQEIKRHIFEPFFSTKFQGRGLGLPAAQGIIRSHNGCIEIESELNRGTTVHVYLPRSRSMPRPQITPKAGHKKTLLVVEDDAIVRNLIQRALERQGYTILLSEDGEQALEIYQQQQADIALIFLDIGLPKLGGMQVFQQLRTLNPEVRVLLSSGYDEASALKSIQIDEKTQFLQKPYSLQDLLDKLYALIQTSDTSPPTDR